MRTLNLRTSCLIIALVSGFCIQCLADTLEIRNLNSKAWGIITSYPDSAISLASRALELSETLNWPPGIEESHARIGVGCRLMGRYDQALSHLSQSLSIREKMGNPCYSAQSVQSIATVYRLKGDYKRALEHYQEGLRIRRENGCGDLSVAKSLESLGVFFAIQGNIPKAKSLRREALSIFESMIKT